MATMLTTHCDLCGERIAGKVFRINDPHSDAVLTIIELCGSCLLDKLAQIRDQEFAKMALEECENLR